MKNLLLLTVTGLLSLNVYAQGKDDARLIDANTGEAWIGSELSVEAPTSQAEDINSTDEENVDAPDSDALTLAADEETAVEPLVDAKIDLEAERIELENKKVELIAILEKNQDHADVIDINRSLAAIEEALAKNALARKTLEEKKLAIAQEEENEKNQAACPAKIQAVVPESTNLAQFAKLSAQLDALQNTVAKLSQTLATLIEQQKSMPTLNDQMAAMAPIMYAQALGQAQGQRMGQTASSDFFQDRPFTPIYPIYQQAPFSYNFNQSQSFGNILPNA